MYPGEVGLTPEQQNHFDNVVAIGAECEYDEAGKPTLPTSDASLPDQSFSREDIRLLRESIAGAGNHVGVVAPDRTQYLPALDVHVSNGMTTVFAAMAAITLAVFVTDWDGWSFYLPVGLSAVVLQYLVYRPYMGGTRKRQQ